MTILEAVARRCSAKKVFLNRKNYRKRTVSECFPVNFAKILRTPFLIEHLWWLLLLFINPFRATSLFLYSLKT